MNHTIITYTTYLTLSIILTIWVGQTLFRRGRIFLLDRFGQNKELTDSVNHLLVVGFYLINFGFVSIYLKLGFTIDSTQQVFEAVSGKLGVVLLVLGGMHFFNLLILARQRHRTSAAPTPPPFTGYEGYSKH